jgi:hypothetical protein
VQEAYSCTCSNLSFEGLGSGVQEGYSKISQETSSLSDPGKGMRETLCRTSSSFSPPSSSSFPMCMRLNRSLSYSARLSVDCWNSSPCLYIFRSSDILNVREGVVHSRFLRRATLGCHRVSKAECFLVFARPGAHTSVCELSG